MGCSQAESLYGLNAGRRPGGGGGGTLDIGYGAPGK